MKKQIKFFIITLIILFIIIQNKIKKEAIGAEDSVFYLNWDGGNFNDVVGGTVPVTNGYSPADLVPGFSGEGLKLRESDSGSELYYFSYNPGDSWYNYEEGTFQALIKFDDAKENLPSQPYWLFARKDDSGKSHTLIYDYSNSRFSTSQTDLAGSLGVPRCSYDDVVFDLGWHLITLIWSKSRDVLDIYIDGDKSQCTIPQLYSNRINSTDRHAQVGITTSGIYGTWAKNLTIDEWKIYDYAKTQSQIQEDYTSYGLGSDPYDINDDGIPDCVDFFVIKDCFEQPIAGECVKADLNEDETISLGDLILFPNCNSSSHEYMVVLSSRYTD